MRSIQLREERNFSEVINTTFQFTFQNLKTLGPILLYFAAPFSLISGISVGLFQSQIFDLTSRANKISSFSAIFSLEYFLSIVFSLMGGMVLSLVVSSYLVEYMDREGPVEASAVWEHVKKYFFRAVVVGLLYAGSLILGLALCFLPVVYPFTVFSLANMAMVREDLSASEALSRSRDLVHLSWTEGISTFGLRLVMSIATSILGSVLSVPMYLFLFLQGMKVIGENMQWAVLLSSVIATTGTTVITSLANVALGVQYFSLVEKKEGIGLMNEIEAIGQARPVRDEGDY